MKILALLPLILSANLAYAECLVSNIKIKSIKTEFISKCKTRDCFHLNGVAVLDNQCKESIGVQIKSIAYDIKGSPVSVEQFWPASVENINTGEYIFSMNWKHQYDPAIHRIEIKPIKVKKWN